MKDEFIKLAYIPFILWGKKKRLLNFFLTNLGMGFYKSIWYKYIFSNLQALQWPFGCFKRTVNSCLVLLLCEIYCSKNDTSYVHVF